MPWHLLTLIAGGNALGLAVQESQLIPQPHPHHTR